MIDMCIKVTITFSSFYINLWLLQFLFTYKQMYTMSSLMVFPKKRLWRSIALSTPISAVSTRSFLSTATGSMNAPSSNRNSVDSSSVPRFEPKWPYWRSAVNRRKFFDWLAVQLEYKVMEDWYNITE